MGAAAPPARRPHQPQARAAADPGGRAARPDAAGAQALRRGCTRARSPSMVPDTLWATDATEAWTRGEGRCAVFVIIDHASNEVWYDAARRMDRFAAADLLREVCAERFGSVERAVAVRARACATTAAPASAPTTTRPRSTTSASPARPPSTTSPRRTAAPRKRSRPSKSRCSGSNASRHSTSCAHAVRSFGRTYNQRVADRTPRLPHPDRGARTPTSPRRPPRHDQPVHHSVRRTGAGGREESTKQALRTFEPRSGPLETASALLLKLSECLRICNSAKLVQQLCRAFDIGEEKVTGPEGRSRIYTRGFPFAFQMRACQSALPRCRTCAANERPLNRRQHVPASRDEHRQLAAPDQRPTEHVNVGRSQQPNTPRGDATRFLASSVSEKPDGR